MSRTIEIASNAAASAWTDLTAVLPWPDTKWGGMAHDLEVGTGSGFNLDDDAGTRVLPVKRVFRVIETATSPDAVLFKGRVSDKTLARGTRFEDDAKAFDTSLDDNNSQVYGIPVDGWVRPAETGRARVLAVIAAFANGSPRASTVIDATTYVPNTNTVSMPAKRYDLTDVSGVIRDCAATEGKQAFINVHDELFYDVDTSTAYAAGLSITDDGPDLSTEFPPVEPSGEEQGNEFFTGGTLRYGTSGSVSEVRSAAETAHDYWRIAISDGDATAVTAPARLTTMLDNQSVEEKTYRCAVQLTAAQVDLIEYGQTVSYRSAATGVLTPVTLRVASLYWEPIAVDLYLAHLELGVPEKFARRVRSTPPSVPAVPCVPTDYTVFSTSPAPNMSCVGANHGVGTAVCSSSPAAGDVMTLYAGATYRIRHIVYHSPSSFTLFAGIRSAGAVNGPITNMGATRDAGILWAPGTPPPEIFAEQTYTPAVTDDYQTILSSGIVATGCDNFASSLDTEIWWMSGPDPRFVNLPVCAADDPASGQPGVETDTGDGETTARTTSGPYVPGSLRVFVDNTDQTSAVTETDPATGSWTLAFVLEPDETYKLYYQAA